MNPLYFSVWVSCKVLFKIYFRWEVYGLQYIPRTGPVLIASNHASFLDPVLLGTSLPRDMHYLARKTLFKNPIFGKILHIVNAVPVDRDGNGMAGLKAILERLNHGCAINLFPEGTRTTTGKLQKAHTGIGLTVIKSTAPVIPARIFGSFEAYGKGSHFPKPKKIIIRYGAPIDFSALRLEAKTCTKERLREIYQNVTDTVMDNIAHLTPHAN